MRLDAAGAKVPAPAIAPGDELWIRTHEHDDVGRGRGMTAEAVAERVEHCAQGLAVNLRSVRLLDAPSASGT